MQTEIDLNESEHFIKANLDRSEIEVELILVKTVPYKLDIL